VVLADTNEDFNFYSYDSFLSDEGACVPRVRKTTRNGEIEFSFSKKLEPVQNDNDLTTAIINSGSIQLQLLSTIRQQKEEGNNVDLSFDWNITSISTSGITILVNFTQP